MTYNQVYHGQSVCYQRQKAIVVGIGTYTPRLRSVVDWIVGRNTDTTKIRIEFSDGSESSVLLSEIKCGLSSDNKNKPKGRQ